MNKVYKWFEDNIYYSVNSGKASIYLENDDLFEFENMLKELVTNYTNLQSKIDKAIEYINKLKNFKIKYVMLEEKELYASEKDFVKDLLDILKENRI